MRSAAHARPPFREGGIQAVKRVIGLRQKALPLRDSAGVAPDFPLVPI